MQALSLKSAVDLLIEKIKYRITHLISANNEMIGLGIVINKHVSNRMFKYQNNGPNLNIRNSIIITRFSNTSLPETERIIEVFDTETKKSTETFDIESKTIVRKNWRPSVLKNIKKHNFFSNKNKQYGDGKIDFHTIVSENFPKNERIFNFWRS